MLVKIVFTKTDVKYFYITISTFSLTFFNRLFNKA